MTLRGLTVYAAVDKQTHHKSVADLLPQPEPAPLPANASAKEKMAHRMKKQAGTSSVSMMSVANLRSGTCRACGLRGMWVVRALGLFKLDVNSWTRTKLKDVF